jgi:hypothetical protein
MKTRQLTFGVVGIVGLVIAFEIGLHLRAPHAPNPNTRVITISASPPPDVGKCEVDFPVAFLRYNLNQSVQWVSSDNKYWISFLTIDSPPDLPADYKPENPLAPPDDPVIVEPHIQPRTYHVKPKTKYYMYAIYDHDPSTNSNNPCKAATDDKDTGLNIKP